MNFKKIILGLALASFLLTNCYSQPGRERIDPAERAKRQTEELTKELSLNTDQSKKVGEILLESANKMKKVFESNTEDRDARREAMLKIRTEEKEKLNKVLTKEQQTKYIEYLKKREEERKNRRRPDGDRPQRQ
ncbi:MAG: hypothetical protein JW717_03275 [Marinilabiliaceae bacterium]|nr:hypothetical protein [Marinilabiliaceae bacterium]